VNLWAFFSAAVLLSVERICYLWIWRKPAAFRHRCERPPLVWIGDPVDVLALLCGGFKVLQCAVFIGWCYLHGDGSLRPLALSAWSSVLGAMLIAGGQILNLSVFHRLGKVGVFYGNRLGYEVPWHLEFPFSFFKHPQYVGTLLSIWGFFFVMRFPHNDWYLLPILETIYYALAAYYER
jgi:methylene-fatty-acyl-phospholipid synthase